MHTLSTTVYILNHKINGNRTIAKTSGSLQKTIGIYSNSLIQSVSVIFLRMLDLRDWWLELKQVSKKHTQGMDNRYRPTYMQTKILQIHLLSLGYIMQ